MENAPVAPQDVFIVQQNAEILAGVALTYLVNPETPIVYCPASTAADMRNANVAYAAPEQFLINTPGLQLANDRYRLPTRILAGMIDSELDKMLQDYLRNTSQ